MDNIPFPVLECLKEIWRASGPRVPGTKGQVLRALFAEQHECPPIWVDSEIVETARALIDAPDHVRLPAIASISLPAPDLWLEFERRGKATGLLVETFNQGIGVRRVELPDRVKGPQIGSIMAVVEPPKDRPRVDWNALATRRWNAQSPKWERVWRGWAASYLATGSTEDYVQPDKNQIAHFLANFGIEDLMVVALVCSGHFDSSFRLIGKDGLITRPTEGNA